MARRHDYEATQTVLLLRRRRDPGWSPAQRPNGLLFRLIQRASPIRHDGSASKALGLSAHPTPAASDPGPALREDEQPDRPVPPRAPPGRGADPGAGERSHHFDSAAYLRSARPAAH